MIQVVYYRKYNRLTMTGHAGAADPGHDLVCASASMLAYTLAVNVENMAYNKQVRQPILKLTDGESEISCNPKCNLKNTVTLVFDTICAGFELLAHDYPQNISYEIR